MKIKLVSFGIAKDIIGSKELDLENINVRTVSDLKSELVDRFPDFVKLKHFSLAINEEYRDGTFEVKDGDEVIIIPPVSGG